MSATIQVMLWGPRGGSELANLSGWQEQEALISERVQHALAQRTPTLRVQSVCVAQDCRMCEGARCTGYVVAVVVSVGYALTAPSAVCALECQVESLVSVAMLDLFKPLVVEQVEVVSEPGDSTISA